MKNSHSSPFCLFIFLCLCLSLNLAAQTTLTYYNQSFVIDTLYPATGSAGMNSPWEVLYGPDDSLWVTESHAYKIWKIHPGNKGSRMVLDMNTAFYKDFNSTTANPWPQGGLMGLAILFCFAATVLAQQQTPEVRRAQPANEASAPRALPADQQRERRQRNLLLRQRDHVGCRQEAGTKVHWI